MFEVLMFLFENYIDSTNALKIDNKAIVVALENIGFGRYEIDRALSWLDGLNEVQTTIKSGPAITPLAMRYYLTHESECLGVEGKGFLFYLERLGILDPISREIVIDRVMALESAEITIPRIRWVVLLVLFNQPERKAALTLLQEMIMADAFGVRH
jgi:Smg protein